MAIENQTITKRYALYNGDCCKIMPQLPDESIGFSIFSPPFCNLYSYSDEQNDMSNCKSYEEFFEHFQYTIIELMRLLMPGRIIAVHCMDLPIHKSDGEFMGLRDFSGSIIKAFESMGFIFHSRHCIWKDPLIAAVRTHALGLAHKQIVKDSAMCRTGIPDYILAFRKPGDNPKPIVHKGGLVEYYGSRPIPKELNRFIGHKEQKTNKRSHWIWQQYASPVWFDIRQTNVLSFRKAKAQEDEKHICPLQLDVIERCMALWTKRGDKVLTPFMGIGSEVYVAIKNRRRAIGIELKQSYYKQAIKHMKQLENKRKRNTLYE